MNVWHKVSENNPVAPRGLITSVNDSFKATIKTSLNNLSTWDGQMFSIKEGGLQKTINLFNIYKPPKDRIDKYCEFTEELCPILIKLPRKRKC